MSTWVRQLIHSFTPALFVDLIQHYDRLLPSTLAKKKRESERKIPQRKRTAMVDMRMRRSNISEVSDLKEAIIQQTTRRTGPGSRSSISTTGPPESVKALSPPLDSRANVPSTMRTGGGAINTSPVPPPPPPQIAAPNPTPAFVTPPPPPFEAHAEFLSPPPPPGFVAPPPPPPLTIEPEEEVSFPAPQPSYSNNFPAPDGYVPPPMPTFRDPSDGLPRVSPTFSSDPPSRSSSPAIGGTNRPGAPQRTTPVLRGPRTGGLTRSSRTSVPAPGRRESYGQQYRPQTPPSSNDDNLRGSRPTSTGPYIPAAHRRSGSGSSFARRTMASDAEVN